MFLIFAFLNILESYTNFYMKNDFWKEEEREVKREKGRGGEGIAGTERRIQRLADASEGHTSKIMGL